MVPGIDFIGVGVGAIVWNNSHQLMLAQRGPAARNEVGTWEFPGGLVSFGERLEDAVKREFVEEYGVTVEIIDQLGAFDHFLPEERQHWVSITYVARYVTGRLSLREPDKCLQVAWFSTGRLPSPLSTITQANLRRLRELRDGSLKYFSS